MSVFVLGMHRSGTSAVARLVNLLGVSIGETTDLMPPTEANPRGYWESSTLRAFNDELLEGLGGSWAAPPRIEPGWESSDELRAALTRARTLFRLVYRSSPWIWKDPRNCLVLPFWVKALAVRPVIVLVRRNPLEIWRSLARRDEFSKPTALALWERYMRQLLRDLAGFPVFALSYDRLLADPAGCAAALRAFLVAQGIHCDSTDRGAEIRAFLAPELRHAEYGPRAIEDDLEVSAAQRELFLLLERLDERNEAFTPPPLHPESSSTEPLLGERRRLEIEIARHRRERRRLERFAKSLFDLEVYRAWEESETGESPSSPAMPPVAADAASTYQAWLTREERLAEGRGPELAQHVAALERPPTIAIVMAVESASLMELAASVDSLRSQSYPRWQLSIGVRGASEAALRFLDEATRADRRIVVGEVASAGTWAGLNAALSLADGDWVGFLGTGDRLGREALAEVAVEASGTPERDVVYTDEDSVSPTGARLEPRFKPDWSPDLLLAQPYLGGLLAIRRAIVERIGAFRTGFDGAEIYDFALRATEVARAVAHVPKVLYHRAARERSDGAGALSDVAARQAIGDALARRGESAIVETGDVPGTFRVQRAIRSAPRVSIIIPFRDEPELLRRCIESIRRFAGYEHWEAILVDNQSWQPETRALLARLEAEPRSRLLRYDEPFNWSAINNWAARQTTGDMLLFLNNDIEACRPGWLAAMVEHAERPEVGAVGARLLYPNRLVQHGGVIISRKQRPDHAFRFLPADAPGYLGLARSIRNCTAVTGACLLMRRAVFEEMSGFDESFGVAFNDVDLCLRLRERGYWIVYTPFAELIHFESASRGVADEIDEGRRLAEHRPRSTRADPYFNPNLNVWRPDFGLAVGEESPS